jgi:hypothetical protein
MHRSTIVPWIILIALVLTVVGVLGWSQYQEFKFQALVKEVQGLLPGDSIDRRPEPPVVRGLLEVWDQTVNQRITFYEKGLPSERLAGSASRCETLIWITRIEKENPVQYTNGAIGYSQSATLFIVLLPEKKMLGPYTVKGKEPPIVALQHYPNEPILGDLKEPLGAWVNGLPLEDRGRP